MRSAGCIVNDIADKNFDKKVERTKNRPIASEKVSIKLASTYALFLCTIAFLVLINFNNLTILMALASMPLAFTYPLMKRITYWPQLFLGFTFNWGIIMAWSAVNNDISIEIIILYISAIFWTLGYDTIYGAQDISDDEIIGLKSTSIKFKKNINQFVASMYLISMFLICYLFKNEIGCNFFTLLLGLFLFTLIFQVFMFDKNKKESCLKMFKTNNLSGLILFLSILTLND
jgi:4-hydroxybenzoate polyprenyl transferase